MSSVRYRVNGKVVTEEEFHATLPNRLDTWTGNFSRGAYFDTHYSRDFGRVVSSFSQEEKAVKEHNKRIEEMRPEEKNPRVHRRIGIVNEDSKFMNEQRNIAKNKKDYLLDRWKKSGKDPATLTAKHKKWFGISVVALLILVSPAYAEKLKGIPWTDITVNGVYYEIPIYNPDITEKIYLLKKALEGDTVARDMILGPDGKEEIFIGDGERHLWLIMDETGEYVKEYK